MGYLQDVMDEEGGRGGERTTEQLVPTTKCTSHIAVW